MSSAHAILGAIMWPALFWSGAAAVSVPILIHLFARRRFKRIRWAAIDFLLEAERRNRRRMRLEEWILLLLRCLAFVVIALLVARPFIKPVGLMGAIGGGRSTERIFLLDDSYSMTYESDGSTSFARAKDAVMNICRQVRQVSPDDTVTILRASAPDSPVEFGTYLNEAQLEDVAARLEALQPSNQPMDVDRLFTALTSLLQQSPDIVNAVLYVVSDFQRFNWAPRQSGGEDANVFSPLVEWSNEQRSLRVTLVNVGVADAVNRAITQVRGPSAPIVAGATATLKVSVVNHSETPFSKFKAFLAVDDAVPNELPLSDLAPFMSAVIDTPFEFVQPGYTKVVASLPPDGLSIDDSHYAVVNVARAIQVLVVNGEPAADSFLDEVTYLTTALKPKGEVFSGNEVEVIEETELESQDLSNMHVVVLANVFRVSDPAAEALERFVRRGGGLILFLGDQVDVGLYNTTLYRNGEGILPVQLTQRELPVRPAQLVVTDRLHPMLRGLSPDGDPLGIGQIDFNEFFGSTVDDDPALGDNDARHASRVLARFSDELASPAIVEGKLGEGRVIAVMTSADKEWHRWPDHPTYLPLVLELVNHTARRSDLSENQWTGVPIEWVIDPESYGVDATVRTPSYPVEPESTIRAQPTEDGGRLVMKWEQTQQPGTYEFQLTKADGQQERRYVAVNVDPVEGDLTPADKESLLDVFAGVPVTYVDSVAGVSDDTEESRIELWRPALLAAVLILLSEQSLAWWWGRKR